MRSSWSQFGRFTPSTEPRAVLTDDGGSGLLEACRSRFAPPEFEVECDASHTVWVKRTGGMCSFGLAPWVVRYQSMHEVLMRMEAKLQRAH